jgi:hypothetical protein
MKDALSDLIAAESAREIPAPVRAFAAALAAHANGQAAAVLFYGSNLRSGDLDGVLDFYVLVDNLRAWHRRRIAALANRLLPPNVEYREQSVAGLSLLAKVAVMTPRQFAAATRFASLDTTIWARFSQPVAIAWTRDAAAHSDTVGLLANAVTAASRWAALLGPERGMAADYWRALYAATYAAELRVERAARPDEIVHHAAGRYAKLLKPAWRAAGIAFSEDADIVTPGVTKQERVRARRGWALRRMLGKPLNIARLAKAAFTFQGGAAYLAWKAQRHTQVELRLTPWQQRHPILAAPRVMWRLWRRGLLR